MREINDWLRPRQIAAESGRTTSRHAAIPLLLSLFTPMAEIANAGAATGTVALVEVNNTFGGVFLELNISPTFYYEASCPVPGFAFLPSSDPLYSTFLATVLSGPG